MIFKILLALTAIAIQVQADCPPCSNQTSYFTAPLSEDSLPFSVTVEQADFSLGSGIHSFAFATYKGEWLFVAGRTNGLHNVDNEDPSDNSFPPSQQNTTVYVVNPSTGITYSRSLYDATSLLTQAQIDLLSVSNPISDQTANKKVLYLVGGYGIDTATGVMGTKAAITAIDVPQLIQWVKDPKGKTARGCMRFAFHPLLQVTGGVMSQANPHKPYLLLFGQNFDGLYVQTSDGTYSRKVGPCQIIDNGKSLSIQPYTQPAPQAVYRRRDLNVVPIIKKIDNSYQPAFVALSGVFTPGGEAGTPGAWTAPIEISADGSSKMVDPSAFSQAMNNYSCPTLGLYSQKSGSMHTMLFGGISAVIGIGAGDCDSECQASIPTTGTNFVQCCNLPFVNDITTIEIDKTGTYRQYLMNTKFPTIGSGLTLDPCTGDPLTDPRILFFGASAAFIPNESLPMYSNGVINLDKLGSSPVFLGYVVGGIASSLTDTNCPGDSTASRYVFKVTLQPR